MAEYDGSFKLGVELDTTQAKKDLDNFVKDASKQTNQATKPDSQKPSLIDPKATEKSLTEVEHKVEKTVKEIHNAIQEEVNKSITHSSSNMSPIKDIDVDGKAVFGKQAQATQQRIQQTTLQLNRQTQSLNALDAAYSATFNKSQNEISNQQDKITELTSALDKFKTINAETLSQVSPSYKKMTEDANQYNAELRVLESQANEIQADLDKQQIMPWMSEEQLKEKEEELDEVDAKLQEINEKLKATEDLMTAIESGDYESLPEYQKTKGKLDAETSKLINMQEKQAADAAKYQARRDVMQQGIQATSQRLQQQKGTAALTGQNTQFGQILGMLQSGSLKGIVDGISTALIALPEPLTTTLGIIMKIVGALTIIKTILAPIKKLILGIVNTVKKVLGMVVAGISNLIKSIISLGKRTEGFGSIFQKIFKRILGSIKNIVFYNVLSKQMRELTQTFSTLLDKNEQLKKSLGQIKGNLLTAFAPIYSFVLPAIQRLCQALVTLSGYLANLVSGLFGKTISESQKLAKSLDAQAKAGGSASKSLAGFDKLNTISTGGGIDAIFDALTANEKLEGIIQRLRNMLSLIFKPFKKSWDKWGLPTIENIKSTFESILDLALSIGESFARVWGGKNGIGLGLPILNNLWEILNNIISTVHNLTEQFKKAWAVWGDDIWQGILTSVKVFLDHIRNITRSMKEWSSEVDFGPLLKGLRKVSKALEPFSDAVGEGLEQFYEDVLEPLGTWLTEKGIPTTLDLIANLIENVAINLERFNKAMSYCWDTYLKPFAEKMGDRLLTILGSISTTLSILNGNADTNSRKLSLMELATIGLTGALRPLLAVLENVTYVIQSIIGWVELIMIAFHDWDLAVTILKTALQQRFPEIYNAFVDLKNKVAKIIETIKSIMSGIITKAEEITSKLRQVSYDVANYIINQINKIIDAIGRVISKISDGISQFGALSGAAGQVLSNIGDGMISFEIPALSPTSTSTSGTGKQKTTSTSSSGTPRINSAYDYLEYQKKKKGYATGTVIPPSISPFLGLLGDNNQETEVVSPLSTMKQAMIEAMSESGLGGGGTFHIHLDVDGKEIASVVKQQSDIYKRRTGRSLLV